MMGAKFAVFILFLCLCGVMVNHALPSVKQSAGQVPESGLRTIQEPLWPRRRSVDNLPQPPGPNGKRFEEDDAMNDKN